MKALIRAVSEQTELPEGEVAQILQAALDGITERLVADGHIRLGEFGAFELRLRKARKGRNPRTGERLLIPASVKATFRPGKALRERVGELKQPPQKG